MWIKLISLFALSSSLLAQTSTGTLSGAIFDPSGAVIPGAKIRLLGTETGEQVREIAAGADGSFVAPLLRPTAYTIEVSAEGF